MNVETKFFGNLRNVSDWAKSIYAGFTIGYVVLNYIF